MMRLALYQPDIPQNAGTILRTAACFGVPVDIIEPCGFNLSDRHFRRAGMDYLDRALISRHRSWREFRTSIPPVMRLVLLTTKGDTVYSKAHYGCNDILVLGAETAGVPAHVHAEADLRVRIPISHDCRSLNVAVACAVVLGEALRQTGGFGGERL